MTMAKATRSKSALWLLGAEETEITGTKLPSKRQALCVLLYHHKTLKKTIHESAIAVMKEVLVFWDKARIPVRPEHHAIKQLETLHDKWKKLKKNAKRTSETQQSNVQAFADQLGDLFDIAHQDALILVKNPEDREFLLAQREKGRRGCMGSADMTLNSRETRRTQRQSEEHQRLQQAQQEMAMMDETVALTASEDSTEEDIADDDSVNYDLRPAADPQEEIQEPSTSKPTKRARKNIVSPELAATLDRTKLSDRKATFVLAATARSLGNDIQDLTINRSSIRRARLSLRQDISKRLKDNFDPKTPLTVHWDGKLLQDLTGKELVDRLPVLVSGLNTYQLLGVPKLVSGTGEAQATAVDQLLEDWGLKHLVRALCFDTTATNTGQVNGACALLESKLDRTLLNFACRHHILELVLASVFTTCMGPTSGPDVQIFKRFQKHWEYIDRANFKSAMTNDGDLIADIKDDTIEFAIEQLESFQPRDDYRELLELIIIFLGGDPPRGTRFMAPGAIHHARWMAKALYALKIYLFRDQFKLTAYETSGIRDVCVFIVRLYARAWFTAPDAIAAPYNDLRFLQCLKRYEGIHSAISKAAVNKFSGHLWYLSEELIALALFDPAVPADTKRAMVQAIVGLDGVQRSQPKGPKRIKIAIKSIEQASLTQFVTENTLNFFGRLDLPTEFLQADPDTWDCRDDYKAACTITHSLKVVNDLAERGVALIEQYNSLLTKDEEQKQYLLQVVQDHRSRFPDARKSTLTTSDY